MDSFQEKLNDLLVDTFRNILKVEQNMLAASRTGLSLNEMHLIEAVGREDGRPKTVSELAGQLEITLASVTIAVNKLIKKGYLEKSRSRDDGRSVQIGLTREGVRMERLHRYFHKRMVTAVTSGISEQEKAALLSGVEKLDAFFRSKVSETEE